ncbi:M15 family metallopeptidase [Deinococcus sp. RIT780]|uniref:M15 family metallopeptidase n=1 Tax=Deinococcus sp. RIT780 TaxID=2870472 RepID=UPI001C896B7B|nr:M15 family metallopeptidase [Deinococcus sp. RIT780]MBX8464914.1 M15 family metallopeptidase [Deinococcus sp. RIT780]
MAQLLHALTVTGLLATWASASAALSPQETAQVDALIRAYPAFLSHVDGQALVWRDGTRMPLTRSNATSYTGRLNSPGLLDQLAVPYPACAPLRTPAWNVDPGRTRFEPLFRRMYGGTAAQVKRNLRAVNWFGQSVQVTRVNGVDRSLQAVAAELARSPELRPFVTPSAGTFLWRTVAGTPRLSVHSFGAAIDLNVARSSYWAWNGYLEGQRGITYRNAFPLKLVQVFERHGWIWGGRWYHHDTMHFEYRPELTGADACQNR